MKYYKLELVYVITSSSSNTLHTANSQIIDYTVY